MPAVLPTREAKLGVSLQFTAKFETAVNPDLTTALQPGRQRKTLTLKQLNKINFGQRSELVEKGHL